MSLASNNMLPSPFPIRTVGSGRCNYATFFGQIEAKCPCAVGIFSFCIGLSVTGNETCDKCTHVFTEHEDMDPASIPGLPFYVVVWWLLIKLYFRCQDWNYSSNSPSDSLHCRVSTQRHSGFSLGPAPEIPGHTRPRNAYVGQVNARPHSSFACEDDPLRLGGIRDFMAIRVHGWIEPGKQLLAIA